MTTATPPPPGDTCWTVLRAASAGDEEARSTFSRTYAAMIRGYLAGRWRGGPLAEEIDDASQEAFLECLKPGGALERADVLRGDFRGLLYGVVQNVARRFEERARRRLGQAETRWLQELTSDDASQATAFDRDWARTMMREAGRRHRERALADGLAGSRRLDLLERRFSGNEAIRQIAASWGVDAQDVHNAYRKARGEFYGCLREVVARHLPPGADPDPECRRLLGLLA